MTPEQECARIRALDAADDADARFVALSVIDALREAYSRDVALTMVGHPMRKRVWLAQRALRRLEADGLLISEVRTPDGERGMARRYYRRPA